MLAIGAAAGAMLSAPMSLLAQVRHVYPEPADSRIELATAVQSAATSHRRIILDFGGNWCPDCLVLDSYFHDAANKLILEANFVLVHVNVGRMNENLDIAAKYQIPLNKGVPALAVLDLDGKLLYSQRTGEFEAMRGMQSSTVTRFLEQWKPPRS